MILKFFFVLAFLTIMINFIFSQNCTNGEYFYHFKNYSKKYGLSGKVKSIEEYEFEQFVPDSMLISFVSKTILKFDTFLRLKKETIYLEKGKMNLNCQYEYDSKGNTIKQIVMDSSGVPLYTINYIYDYAKNSYRKVSESTKNNPDSFKFIEDCLYDKKGNLLVVNSIYPVKKVSILNRYVYNKAGLLTKVESLDPKTKKIISYEMLIFNTEENSKITRTFSADNSLLYEQYRFYDVECRIIKSDFNNYVIEYTYHGNTNNLLSEVRKKYSVIDNKLSYKVDFEFDLKGNWIKKTVFRLDNTKLTSVKRKIEYYE